MCILVEVMILKLLVQFKLLPTKTSHPTQPLHYTFKKQKVRILLPKIKKYVHNDAIVEHECENTIAKDTDLCEVITLLVEQVKPTRT